MPNKALFLIAQDDFRDEELFDVKETMESEGIPCIVASPTGETAHGKLGGTIEPDLAMKDVNIDDYETIITVGGPGAVGLINVPEYNELIKQGFEKNKLNAAICIAPTLLAKNNLLKGKKSTVWNGDGEQEKVLTSHGAIYIDEDIVIDDNYISASGPKAAKDFGKALAKKMKV